MRFKSNFSAILLSIILYVPLNGQLVQSRFSAGTGLKIIENRGQLKDEYQQPLDDILYYAIDRNVGIYFRKNSVSFVFYHRIHKVDADIQQDRIPLNKQDRIHHIVAARADLKLAGANPNTEISAFEPEMAWLNFYLSHTGDAGICDVRQYRKLQFKEIYKNIDLEFLILDSGIKYNFILHPGSRVEDIKMEWSGTEPQLTPAGGVVYKTLLGVLNESAPVVQCTNQENIKAGFHFISPNVLGFVLDKSVEGADVIIDPVIKWGTYYGGNEGDYFVNVIKSQKGGLFTPGITTSGTGIATSGAFQDTFQGEWDVFISKFTENGALIWSTYFGGDSSDYCSGTLLDKKNRLYISGWTTSTKLSTSTAWQKSRGLMDDNFLAQFNDSGKRIWCTYFGGSDLEWTTSLTLDTAQNIVMAGMTYSSGMATSGVYQTAGLGGWDLYLAKFNDSGNRLLASTYFGGNSSDFWPIVSADLKGRIYIAGNTWSDSFISKSNVHQKVLYSSWSPVLASFDDSLKNLNWSTYFGGSGETGPADITVDDSGYIVMSGWTYSDSLIAFGTAYQKSYAGSYDGFLSKFSDTGTIIWSTYFGGTGSDGFGRILLTDSGRILASGSTSSNSGIADSCAMRDKMWGLSDIFIIEFNRSGFPVWSTYWGGEYLDYINGIAADKNDIYLAGSTFSDSGIATSSGYKKVNVNGDGYLVKLHRKGKYYDTLIVKACKNFKFKGNIYTSAGNYDMSYNRCGDTIYSHIKLTLINEKKYFYKKVCDSFKLNNKVYTQSGTYIDTVFVVDGCDTVYTIELTINKSSDTLLGVTACDSFLFQNQTFMSPGTYYFNIKNFKGCDSLITLELKMESSKASSLDTTVCYFLNLNGKRYNSSGTHIQHLVTQSGCDSTLTINLTILTSTKSYHDLAYCDSAVINGIVYTSSGEYTQKIKNYLGCDSIIFLTLEIRKSTDTTLVVDVCDSFELNGITYLQTGNYTQKLINSKVCDSFIYLHLNIKNSSDSILYLDTCREVTVNGMKYSFSGNYEQYLVNSENCDSVLRLKIKLEDYRWHYHVSDACGYFQDPQKRHYWTQSGTYFDTVYHTSGCDSIYEYRINFIDLNTSVVYSGMYTLVSSDLNAEYQWLDCDNNYLEIPGETGRFFTPVKTGKYAVKLAAYNCTDTSDCYPVEVTADQGLHVPDMLIYPNPVNAGNEVIVQFPGETGHLDLYDLQGRKIGSGSMENGYGVIRPQQPGLMVIRLQSRGKMVHVLLEVR